MFPFDFSAFEFDWESLAEWALILAMIGFGIGVVAELVKLGERQHPLITVDCRPNCDND